MALRPYNGTVTTTERNVLYTHRPSWEKCRLHRAPALTRLREEPGCTWLHGLLATGEAGTANYRSGGPPRGQGNHGGQEVAARTGATGTDAPGHDLQALVQRQVTLQVFRKAQEDAPEAPHPPGHPAVDICERAAGRLPEELPTL